MPEGTVQDSRDPNSPQWGYLQVDDTSQLQYEAKDTSWNSFVLFVHDQKKHPVNPEKFSQVSTVNGAIKAGTKVKFEMVEAELNVDGVIIPSAKATKKNKLWVARITDVIPKDQLKN